VALKRSLARKSRGPSRAVQIGAKRLAGPRAAPAGGSLRRMAQQRVAGEAAGQRPTRQRGMKPPSGGPLSSQGQNIQRQARAMQRPRGLAPTRPPAGGPLSSQGQNIQRQARAMQRPTTGPTIRYIDADGTSKQIGGQPARPMPRQTRARLGAAAGQRPVTPQQTPAALSTLLGSARMAAQQRPVGAAQQQAKPMGGGQALNMSATAKPAGGGMKKGGAPVRKFQGGGAVYEVNGQRVTKEQYEKAGREMDTPKSKAEEEMMDFAKAAKERAKARAQSKMAPVNKAKGGEAKKPPGLYANIHAKRKRIAAGSKEKMRKVGSKGAPTKAAFIKSAKTARKG